MGPAIKRGDRSFREVLDRIGLPEPAARRTPPSIPVLRYFSRRSRRPAAPKSITLDNGSEFTGRTLEAGRSNTESNRASSVPAVPWRTGSSKASIAGYATSASTWSGSELYRRPESDWSVGAITTTLQPRMTTWRTARSCTNELRKRVCVIGKVPGSD